MKRATNTIQVKVDHVPYQQLEDYANVQGMSLGALARVALRTYMASVGVELAPFSAVKRGRPVVKGSTNGKR